MGKLMRILAIVLFGLANHVAWAQSCTATVNDVTAPAYAPLTSANLDSSGIFSISNCNRPQASSQKFPATFLVFANNGNNYAGSSRRLSGGGSNYLNYGLYRDAGCTATPWAATAANAFSLANSATQGSATVTIPNPLTSGTTFCIRINGGQTTAAPGTYTDTVTLSVTDQNSFQWVQTPVTFRISTTVTASCNLTTPTNIALNYTSFAASASTGQSTFSVTCTNTTPYTLTLDATGGTLLGLNYTLALSATSGTGTGLAQGYTINAAIPAGQSGVCATGTCNASATRMLTLSY